ncbi:hypothetical protein ACFL5V_12035 [Fibrobacterota bacterium]
MEQLSFVKIMAKTKKGTQETLSTMKTAGKRRIISEVTVGKTKTGNLPVSYCVIPGYKI